VVSQSTGYLYGCITMLASHISQVPGQSTVRSHVRHLKCRTGQSTVRSHVRHLKCRTGQSTVRSHVRHLKCRTGQSTVRSHAPPEMPYRPVYRLSVRLHHPSLERVSRCSLLTSRTGTSTGCLYFCVRLHHSSLLLYNVSPPYNASPLRRTPQAYA
jgi:hypothetical protein